MSADAWPYELRKSIVAYNQSIRGYRAQHGNASVAGDGLYVENINVPPYQCRWCHKDLVVHRKAILCLGCDRA